MNCLDLRTNPSEKETRSTIGCFLVATILVVWTSEAICAEVPGADVPASVLMFQKLSADAKPEVLMAYRSKLSAAINRMTSAKRAAVNGRLSAPRSISDGKNLRYIFPTTASKKESVRKWTNWVDELIRQVAAIEDGTGWPIPFMEQEAIRGERRLPMRIGLVGAFRLPLTVVTGNETTFYASHEMVSRPLVIRGVETSSVADGESVRFPKSRVFLVVGTETARTIFDEKKILWQVEPLPTDEILRHLPEGSILLPMPDEFDGEDLF
jgi:hypothetical protein